MEHQFNVELATKVGVEKAVIIHNMYFWINHNAKNKKMYTMVVFGLTTHQAHSVSYFLI